MSIQQMAENVSQKTDRFIAENGGSVRDALIVALARLEWAEWEISQLKSAQQSFAPDVATELRLNDCEVDPEKLPGKYADE